MEDQVTHPAVELDAPQLAQTTMWAVWSREHRAWWRPDASGYTTDFSQAGLYGFRDAINYAACRDPMADGLAADVAVLASRGMTAHLVAANNRELARRRAAEQILRRLVEAHVGDVERVPRELYEIVRAAAAHFDYHRNSNTVATPEQWRRPTDAVDGGNE